MTILVSRAQWGARPRKQGTNELVAHPSNTIHWEGTGWKFPWDHSTCDDKVRAMQDYHMNVRGWSDIAYNYLACPHNYLFEGRGYRQSAANGYESANKQSLAIQAMWGSAAGVAVPDNLKRALLFGIKYCQSQGSTSVVKGHRDWKQTDCPGDELYAWIKAGCPNPDVTNPPAQDEDMTTDASVRQIIKDEASKSDGSIYKVVQTMAIANNEYVRQMKDDFGNYAAAATDASLRDDFSELSTRVQQLVDNQNETKSTLQAILSKLNGNS